MLVLEERKEVSITAGSAHILPSFYSPPQVASPMGLGIVTDPPKASCICLYMGVKCWPGDLPNPGIEPTSPPLTSVFFTTEPLGKPSVVLAT